MLFYSSDCSEVDRVSQELVNAGIPCEIRKGPSLNGKATHAPQAELWIRNDGDCHRAFMLCVHQGVGFAKRAPRKPAFDGGDFDAPLETDQPGEEGETPEQPPKQKLVFAKRVSG